MGISVFTGRGLGASAGGTVLSSAVWNHDEIIAGATPKVIVTGQSGSVIIPIAFALQRPGNASSTYGTNASFNLRYTGTSVVLGTLAPQLTSLSSKQYSYLNTLNGVFNNNLTPSGVSLEIVSVNNTGGVGGTTVIYFYVNYILIPGVAM